jgi:glycosyltransferase involved in cell wall biosynthesis
MKISCLITTYNEEKYIEECLRTTITAKPDEIIVVDDGSNDGTIDVVKKIKAKSKIPIKIVKLKRSGQDKARNAGLKHVEGDVVCFLDADMIVDKNYFKVVREDIQKYDMLDLNDIPIVVNWVSEYLAIVKKATKRPLHAMTYKTELLKEGFTSGYYLDSILTKKLLEKGYTIGISNATVFHHVHTDYRWFFSLGVQMFRNSKEKRIKLRIAYSLLSLTPLFLLCAIYRSIKLKNFKIFFFEWVAKLIESAGIVYAFWKKDIYPWFSE